MTRKEYFDKLQKAADEAVAKGIAFQKARLERLTAIAKK